MTPFLSFVGLHIFEKRILISLRGASFHFDGHETDDFMSAVMTLTI
jgi:hypothetical protein